MKQDCLTVLMGMKFIPKWDGGQYVLLPYVTELKARGLDYKDMLTYVSLRSFDNKDDECYPMHKTIGDKVGLSRGFVMKSIPRLERAGLVTVKRSNLKRKSNYYYFEELTSPMKVPMTFFTINDLTNSEKAMLLCLLRFINVGTAKKVKELAKDLGLTYQQVSKQFNNLIKAGYILKSRFSQLNTAKWDCSFGQGNPVAQVYHTPLKVG